MKFTNFSSDSKLCVLRKTTSGGFNSLLSDNDDGTVGCLNSLVVFPVQVMKLIILSFNKEYLFI